MLNDSDSLNLRQRAEYCLSLQEDYWREMVRPFNLLKPKVERESADGGWSATLGEGRTGVIGIGKTPEEAAMAFDKAWQSKEGAFDTDEVVT